MDPHQLQALGALPYPYPYSYDPLSVAAAAAAAGKRSRDDGGAEVCRDYLGGKCTRGKNCKYIHYDPYGYGLTAGQIPQRKAGVEVCMDFQRGACSRGLDCKYLHVQSPGGGSDTSVATKRSSEVCKDFNRGLCTRGDSCRYVHVTIPTINQQALGGLGLSPMGGSSSAEVEPTKKPKVDGEEGTSMDELAQLRAENAALRDRNHVLEEEIAHLRAQLGLPSSSRTVPYGYSREGMAELNIGH